MKLLILILFIGCTEVHSQTIKVRSVSANNSMDEWRGYGSLQTETKKYGTTDSTIVFVHDTIWIHDSIGSDKNINMLRFGVGNSDRMLILKLFNRRQLKYTDKSNQGFSIRLNHLQPFDGVMADSISVMMVQPILFNTQ